jgi:hypothetical protein
MPKSIADLVRLAFAALAAIVAFAGLAATPANAAAITDCGNYGFRSSTGTVSWGMTPIEGAGTYNVTTRGVSCSTARRFVRRYRGTDTSYPTWNCHESNGYESSDVRCVSGSRVIHWQSGA